MLPECRLVCCSCTLICPYQLVLVLNAGLPNVVGGYDETPEVMASLLRVKIIVMHGFLFA